MIIRKNTPLYVGQRRAFSGQKARQCVPQCILRGVAVLFTVRKHACAPEAKSGRGPKKAYPVILQRVFLRIIVSFFMAIEFLFNEIPEDYPY